MNDEQQIPVAKPVEEPKSEAPTQADSNVKAIVTLILGILSITCMGFLTGIPAIILGKIEMNDIKSGKSPKSGEGMAKIGFILGIIGTALTCLTALAGFALIIFAGIMKSSDAIQQTILSI